MLVLQNVEKRYGDFTALQAIDLEFKQGIYGLLSPNGAGKTTLIKMLVTLIQPTNGQILYNGKPIEVLGESYRELIGYLPQQFGYYKHYTPAKYLTYLAALKGMNKKEVKQRIDDVLEKVALTEVKHKKMRKFSGGMIQRVGIAQALLNDPKILILDEPTAGLDPKERARFRHLLSDLARNRTVIISTHIVSDIESIANEIIMIKNQELLYKASVTDICQTLEGKVFETSLSFDQLPSFRETYLTLQEKQDQGKMLVRFVANKQSHPSWNGVHPQLEDVFLAEYENESTIGR
ncbi:ABC transporter ATP-binding protein [Priestia koreensis]|uniref:ABC transporter ATP-binding protein n=1 Tax=Priestia koreensis TaxID=284581 RepID=UPI001F573E39|nr:ABC transporter ATP-binding protein [Priestia koreensis]UNL86761.1 ABC transporter ATP-binding protein [Priestia koreensis]